MNIRILLDINAIRPLDGTELSALADYDREMAMDGVPAIVRDAQKRRQLAEECEVRAIIERACCETRPMVEREREGEMITGDLMNFRMRKDY